MAVIRKCGDEVDVTSQKWQTNCDKMKHHTKKKPLEQTLRVLF